ncbi:glycine cleavage system H-protein subunit [Xylographa bjoerkii]|nr:glycine cleavage system H-protein subunit [Xylographa bjoerkii]
MPPYRFNNPSSLVPAYNHHESTIRILWHVFLTYLTVILAVVVYKFFTEQIIPDFQEFRRRYQRDRDQTTSIEMAHIVGSTALVNSKHYTSAHEWIELSDDQKTATIGISTYAAKALGDVVFVELPAKDLEVMGGDAIGAVESVKSASDIYAPIAGRILESNAVLEEKPGTINKSAEGEGWIARMEVADPQEAAGLMDEAAYKNYAAKALGDVGFGELLTAGQDVTAGDAIGAVESVKFASDIYAPISGRIVDGNAPLEEKPGTIYQGPEGNGWIAKMEVSDGKEADGLMDAEAYKKFTEE